MESPLRSQFVPTYLFSAVRWFLIGHGFRRFYAIGGWKGKGKITRGAARKVDRHFVRLEVLGGFVGRSEARVYAQVVHVGTKIRCHGGARRARSDAGRHGVGRRHIPTRIL